MMKKDRESKGIITAASSLPVTSKNSARVILGRKSIVPKIALDSASDTEKGELMD